ncbi:hypothetical protein [Bradyrhizobium liaoningense]|uniref:hypothetical protein n=1 Tax=Bradyrhizobium liaoningense TaxID=43992 RepID=UPI001BAB0D20|nr:hypothetical protein [Bradyrhizobium liaoningense]
MAGSLVRWRKAKTAPAAAGAVDLEDRGAVVLKRTIEVSIIRSGIKGSGNYAYDGQLAEQAGPR